VTLREDLRHLRLDPPNLRPLPLQVRPLLRHLLLPGICAAVAFLILISLGCWQIQRLHWKERILAQISTAEANSPVPLSGQPGPYEKVVATGRFRPDLAALYGASLGDTPQGQRLGADLIVPLERPGEPPVLVDRGWVPDPVPANLPWPEGETRVDGYVQTPQRPGVFTPSPDVKNRRFYALDPAEISRTLSLGQVAPFVLVAMGPDKLGQYPVPAQYLPRPPNNHLQYALTWFALAGGLVFVFTNWARTILHNERS
jgi:surfeit locus 1 family protein